MAKPNNQFHHFGQLPPELRHAIWLEALAVPTVIWIFNHGNPERVSTCIIEPGASRSCMEAYNILKKTSQPMNIPGGRTVWATSSNCVLHLAGTISENLSQQLSDLVLRYSLRYIAVCHGYGEPIIFGRFWHLLRIIQSWGSRSHSIRKLFIVHKVSSLLNVYQAIADEVIGNSPVEQRIPDGMGQLVHDGFKNWPQRPKLCFLEA
nr:uncharacterized protein CTRU02_05279 [Colletotrichum truncatum]KAF6794447.1 hypothetical protein CTRU02_05279 [Colletotrichum truncatum]